MDTNLKKSKKVKAFCYRLLTVTALFVAITSAVIGWDALKTLFYYERASILTGDFRSLTEFREYMGTLYNQAMLGYAGAGDDNGYPLTGYGAETASQSARQDFLSAVKREQNEIIYYIQLPDACVTNVSYPIFSEDDGHLLLPQDIDLIYFWNGPDGMLTHFISPQYTRGQYQPNNENAKDISLVLAIKEKSHYIGTSMSQFEKTARGYQAVLFVFLSSCFFTVLFFILGLISRKALRGAKVDYATFSGKLWLEVKLLLLALTGYLFYLERGAFAFISENPHAWKCLWLPALAGLGFYLLYTDLSLNGGSIFTNSIPAKLVRYIREYITGSPWYRRALSVYVATLTVSIVSFCTGAYLLILRLGAMRITSGWPISRSDLTAIIWVFSILLLFAGAYLLLMSIRLRRLLKDTRTVAGKLSELQLGEIGAPLLLSRRSLLADTAEDINKLECGIENAVEQKNRSNKMRVELLTNVSHDLKTPLTSIINYADLLCGEELSPPAADYALALQEKAYRLKNMVQDVFELSKAASGNLPVEKSMLDLAKLIRQTLADMDERIQESSLTFKTSFTTEPVMIIADGEKLYRIFQNLFVNALQYSLEYSRVHIQLSVEGGFACAKVKNTSKGELDFDTEEIMERFVRADSSRTSEGSGLGLSIVQSFTEACGGSFSISTDADMFTACIRFPLAQTESGSGRTPCPNPDMPDPPVIDNPATENTLSDSIAAFSNAAESSDTPQA